MEHDSAHFVGKSEVSRGEWKMVVPIDFHIVLDETSDPKHIDKLAMYLTEIYVTEYVRRSEQQACILSDDDDSV